MWILLDSNDLLDKEYAHLVLDVKVEEGGGPSLWFFFAHFYWRWKMEGKKVMSKVGL